MRKLRLDPETLRIDTFAAEAVSSRRGTVRGQSYWEPTHLTVCPYICGGGQDSDDCPVSYGYGECPPTPNTNCEM